MGGFLPIENGLGQAARAGVKTTKGPGNLLETGMVGTRLRIKQADKPPPSVIPAETDDDMVQ